MAEVAHKLMCFVKMKPLEAGVDTPVFNVMSYGISALCIVFVRCLCNKGSMSPVKDSRSYNHSLSMNH